MIYVLAIFGLIGFLTVLWCVSKVISDMILGSVEDRERMKKIDAYLAHKAEQQWVGRMRLDADYDYWISKYQLDSRDDTQDSEHHKEEESI